MLRSARNPRRVIGAMWETGETRAEGEKKEDKRVLVQKISTQMFK